MQATTNLAAILACAFSLLSNLSLANNDRDSLPTELQRMPDSDLYERLRPHIAKKLSREERTIFNSITFSFPPTANYLHVATRKLGDRREAEISKGFLILNRNLNIGLYQWATLEPARPFSTYLTYIASQLGQDTLTFENGGPLPAYPSYGDWAGIGQADQSRVISDRFDALFKDYTAVLLFAVLHETAHHIHGDVLPDKTSPSRSMLREQEHRADSFAFQKMKELGHSPSSLGPFFLLMTVLEGDITQFTGTHDPSICRLATAMDSSTSNNELDDVFKQLLTVCSRN